MRDVLRWSPIMTPSPEGTFVSNHDYAMLQEECERLRAALAEREPAEKAVRKSCETCKHAAADEEDYPCRSCSMMERWTPGAQAVAVPDDVAALLADLDHAASVGRVNAGKAAAVIRAMLAAAKEAGR